MRRIVVASAAVAPLLLMVALLLPGRFDPIAPLSSAPAPVAALLALAFCAIAVPVGFARREPIPRPTWISVVAGLAGTVVAALSLGDVALVRGGVPHLIVLGAAGVTAGVAGLAVLRPHRRARIGLASAVLASIAVGGTARRGALAPDELLRHAMVLAPGWGASSLAALETRALARPWQLAHYPEALAQIDGAIRARLDAKSVPPEWQDDAHLVRAWILVKRAAAPGIPDAEKQALTREAGNERLLFAEDPHAVAQPFTADGILYEDALRLVDPLTAPEPLRIRIATAWSALNLTIERVDDPALEARAVATLQRLFDENKLDLTHPLYLESVLVQSRRLVTNGDAQGYLALFDALEKRPFPETLKKKFSERAELVRAHPDFGYKPVMLWLQAEGAKGLGKDPRPTYEEIVRDYPTATITSAAKVALKTESFFP